jgi:hypothetical protein
MEQERRELLWQALVASAVDGLITADSVVEAAKDPANVLHGEFEWRDDVAAHRYRLQQARQLIRIYSPRVDYISIKDEAPVERDIVYLHDPRVGPRVQAYVSSATLADDGDASLTAVLLELRSVSAAVTRLARVAHALGVECPTGDLEAAVQALAERLQGRNAA